MTNATPPLWSVEDLATYLAVPRSWVYDNHRRVGLKAHKVGQALRFRPSEVERWLDLRTAS